MPVVDASVVVDWVAPDSAPDNPARRFLAEVVERRLTLVAPRS